MIPCNERGGYNANFRRGKDKQNAINRASGPKETAHEGNTEPRPRSPDVVLERDTHRNGGSFKSTDTIS